MDLGQLERMLLPRVMSRRITCRTYRGVSAGIRGIFVRLVIERWLRDESWDGQIREDSLAEDKKGSLPAPLGCAQVFGLLG